MGLYLEVIQVHMGSRGWALSSMTGVRQSVPVLIYSPRQRLEQQDPSLGNFQKGFALASSCPQPHLPLSPLPSAADKAVLASLPQHVLGPFPREEVRPGQAGEPGLLRPPD